MPCSRRQRAEPQPIPCGSFLSTSRQFRFVVHKLDQHAISMRQLRQAVEEPPAQMPQGKRAQQQGCHWQGIARDLDGPGAQSCLLDDRGGRSSSCAHRLIHDEPGALWTTPGRQAPGSKRPSCRRSRGPDGVLQRTAQPCGRKPGWNWQLRWRADQSRGRPRSRTATPAPKQNDSTSSQSCSAAGAASATAAAATATWGSPLWPLGDDDMGGGPAFRRDALPVRFMDLLLL